MTVSSFKSRATGNKVALNILGRGFLWMYVFIAFGKDLEMRFLAHKVGVCF